MEVASRVLQGALVSAPLISDVRLVNTPVGVLGHQSVVDQKDLAALAVRRADRVFLEQQVGSFDVFVDVALGVDVLIAVNHLASQLAS